MDYKQDFDYSIQGAKDYLIHELEQEMKKIALGYYYEEKTEYLDKNSKVRRTVIKRKYQPSTGIETIDV